MTAPLVTLLFKITSKQNVVGFYFENDERPFRGISKNSEMLADQLTKEWREDGIFDVSFDNHASFLAVAEMTRSWLAMKYPAAVLGKMEVPDDWSELESQGYRCDENGQWHDGNGNPVVF